MKPEEIKKVPRFQNCLSYVVWKRWSIHNNSICGIGEEGPKRFYAYNFLGGSTALTLIIIQI